MLFINRIYRQFRTSGKGALNIRADLGACDLCGIAGGVGDPLWAVLLLFMYLDICSMRISEPQAMKHILSQNKTNTSHMLTCLKPAVRRVSELHGTMI